MSLEELLKIPSVNDFLFDTSIDDALEAVLSKHGLDPERERELIDLTAAVVNDELSLEEMPALLARAFGVDETKANLLAADIAGVSLLPLRDFLPGIDEHIVRWGGRIEDYPQTRVGKAKWTADRLAGELAERMELEFSEVLVKRLGFLITQYFAGEKTRDSTLTFFGRAPSIGGLGMTADKAKLVLDEADVIRQGAVIVDKEEEMHEASSIDASHVEREVEEQPAEVADEQERLPAIAPSHDLAAEVPVIAGRAMQRIQEAAAPAKSKLEAAVTVAVDAAAPTLAAKRIAKKAFADLARAAIRGVRDVYQTREFFARDFRLAGAELETLTEAVERGRVSFQYIDSETSVEHQTSNVASGDNADVFRVSAARTKDDEVRLQEARVTPEARMKASIAERPAPVKPKLTVGSVPPEEGGAQKIVTDVRAATKLMGPVDQLGAMTPTEFRRLSTSPSDAVLKVEDLLLALEKQSYDDRVKGVAAWRKSPVNQLYLAMAAAALKDGVPIVEIGSRRRASGDESLSPAEIRAVASLNAKLRY